MKIAMGIEYDGADFAGWQWQPGRRTVQAAVEAAITKVADRPTRVVCAGRTDAGVHATEQVIHFETDAVRTPYSWVMGCNTALPPDVRVLWAREVPADFHARSSAIARYYRYLILNRPVRSALQRRQSTWHIAPLDVDAMREGARFLIGEHDFSSFRAQDCQSNSPNRCLHFIEIERDGDQVIFGYCANAFLHHMVRNLSGVLLEIGSGKRPPEWASSVLKARDRRAAAATAPADGLYLAGVAYPTEYGLTWHPAFQRLPANASRYSPKVKA